MTGAESRPNKAYYENDAQPIHQHGRCAMKPRSAGYVKRWAAGRAPVLWHQSALVFLGARSHQGDRPAGASTIADHSAPAGAGRRRRAWQGFRLFSGSRACCAQALLQSQPERRCTSQSGRYCAPLPRCSVLPCQCRWCSPCSPVSTSKRVHRASGCALCGQSGSQSFSSPGVSRPTHRSRRHAASGVRLS